MKDSEFSDFNRGVWALKFNKKSLRFLEKLRSGKKLFITIAELLRIIFRHFIEHCLQFTGFWKALK